MPALVCAIKAWMAGTSPAMTAVGLTHYPGRSSFAALAVSNHHVSGTPRA
jgi:hypothetical protein